MPPIDRLNPPPNPFWDFVADMQDHPLFAAYGPPRQQQGRNAGAASGAAASASSTANQPQQNNVDDPPEVDPATVRQEERGNAQERPERGCRGRRRRGSNSDEDGEHRREWHGRRGCGRGRRAQWGAPGGFPFGPHGPFGGFPANPFMAHNPPQDAAAPPPHPGFGPGHQPPSMFPFGPGPHGAGGRGAHHHHGGPPHHHHQRSPHRHPHGRRGPSPRSPPPGGFDLGKFLNELGSRIGMDLTGAAEGLGLERFLPTATHAEVDFEPKADIFDRPEDFIIHVSLPGAKKSDVGVDWDGEHSALHVAGVVHRPEVDESMLTQLVVDGRKRETGVFEKTIRLGTRRDPATIDVAGIKAKMTDGVLVVTVPKTEKQHQKRDVPIAPSISATPSPARNEKHVVFDVDREMADVADPEPASHKPEKEINLVDLTKEPSETNKGKQAEYEAEQKSRESSATIDEDHGAPNTEQEQLPAYNPVHHHDHSDWENFDSEEEGEFVKINVD